MKFIRGSGNSYYNIDHICRIYFEYILFRHKGDWIYDEDAEEEKLCVKVGAVVTENIEAECFRPVTLGYTDHIGNALSWVENIEDREWELDEYICEACKAIDEWDLDTEQNILDFCGYGEVYLAGPDFNREIAEQKGEKSNETVDECVVSTRVLQRT